MFAALQGAITDHRHDRLIPVEVWPPRCGLFLRTELACGRFEAGQKLDIALFAAYVGFACARFLPCRAKFRPAFSQRILGICFVFRAGLGRSVGCSYDFFATIPRDVKRRWSIGGPGSINLKSRDNGS
jgi:hypothetical protein